MKGLRVVAFVVIAALLLIAGFFAGSQITEEPESRNLYTYTYSGRTYTYGTTTAPTPTPTVAPPPTATGPIPITPIAFGVNYAHWKMTVPAGGCGNVSGGGILATYHQTGVRATVQSQLRTMYTNGVRSIRTILWHMTTAGAHTNDWGAVDSVGGVLSPQVTTNLRNFMADIKAVGITKFELAMGPTYQNNPLESVYVASKFEENWQLILYVRPILKASGIATTRIDLMNEAAPSNWWTADIKLRMTNYVKEIWRRYQAAFLTTSDATFSAHSDHVTRLQNLVAALTPDPTFLEAHVYAPGDLQTVPALDAWWPGKLIVGEMYYNTVRPSGATEYLRWPLTTPSPVGCNWNVAPPYRP